MKLRLDNPGILILSHCGYSYFEALAERIRSRGLRVYTLTSQPQRECDTRLQIIRARSDLACVSDSHQLHWDDVLSVLDYLSKRNRTVLACISVWEGYRTLMARANARVGAPDLDSAAVESLCDKFQMRKNLEKSGLTQVKVDQLDADLLNRFQKEIDHKEIKRKRKFIKPRFGAASYATFELRGNMPWSYIAGLQKAMREDSEYGVACRDGEFIVEDYIAGQEYSFEVVCNAGKSHVMAIHEKVGVSVEADTIHETSCVSPPVSLTYSEAQSAIAWVTTLFQKMSLSWGCFHLEAKCQHGAWEVIEINPRIGGALISQSVSLLSQGNSLLDYWLLALLARSKADQCRLDALLQQYSFVSDFSSQRNFGTYFRVYFAESGRRIKVLRKRAITLQPNQIDLFYKPGETVINVPREVFLAQALWKIRSENGRVIKRQLEVVSHESEKLIEVKYAA